MAKKRTATERKARRQKIAKVALQVFSTLSKGLVKVWHKNRSFVISKDDALNLTIEQLESLVGEKKE